MRFLPLTSACCLTFMVAMSATAQADTIVAGGLVKGETWTAANSPYRVQGDLIVSGLIIEPGVEVRVEGPYEIEVVTTMSAVGTPANPIRFRAADCLTPWDGLLIRKTLPGIELIHCHISGSKDSGLTIVNASPTIQHCKFVGNSTSDSGGGLDARLDTGDLTIEDSEFSQNHANVHGGGIRAIMGDGQLILRRCTIAANRSNPTNAPSTTRRGGGIWIDGDAHIKNTVVRDNSVRTHATGVNAALSQGGGIYSETGAIVMENSVVTGNFLQPSGGFFGDNRGHGGGVFIGEGSTLEVANSIIGCNAANGSSTQRLGGGLYTFKGEINAVNIAVARNFPAGIHNQSGTLTLLNSIVFFNNEVAEDTWADQIVGGGAASYCNIQGLASLMDIVEGDGNFSLNPGFRGNGCNPVDFSTFSAASGTDSGDPSPEHDDACLDVSSGGVTNDVGAFGGPLACDWDLPTSCPSDLNNDGMVTSIDLATVLSFWGTCDPFADIDASGDVGALDLATVLGDWGMCEPMN